MPFEYRPELIAGLKSGDKHSVKIWYEQTSPKLRGFFASRVRFEKDIDELVHDTLLSTLSSLPLYRGDANFFSWMMGIARHELGDYYRKLYAKRTIAVLPLGDMLLSSVSHETYDMHDLVAYVLDLLPKTVAELLQLKYVDQLSVEEIGKKFKLAPHAVQGRLYRARIAFRKMYKEMEEKERRYETT